MSLGLREVTALPTKDVFCKWHMETNLTEEGFLVKSKDFLQLEKKNGLIKENSSTTRLNVVQYSIMFPLVPLE